MTDDEVQKEIEENQARKRDTEDVGLEEDYIEDRDEGGNVFTDLVDTVFHPDKADDKAPGDMDHEYDDNTKSS